MKINLDLSAFWKGYIDPKKVEKAYNVKFVCETPIKLKNGWYDSPSLIFYSEEPHPQGSNYMALSVFPTGMEGEGQLTITDGISATEGDFVGMVDGDEVIYSRYRHDYRVGKTGVFIDGGRDYTRSSGGQVVKMKIIEGNLEVTGEVKDEESV